MARGDRAAWFDEALPLIRRLWLEDAVDHDGPRFHFEGTAGAAQAASSSRPTSGSAASRRPSCAASGAWPTAGCRRSSLPDGRGHGPGHDRRGDGRQPRARHRPRALRRPHRLRHERARPECLTLLAKRRPDLDPTELVPDRPRRPARRHRGLRRGRLLEVRRAALRRARPGDAAPRPPRRGGRRTPPPPDVSAPSSTPDGDALVPDRPGPRAVGPDALHGGPTSALLARAVERAEPPDGVASRRSPASPSSCSGPVPVEPLAVRGRRRPPGAQGPARRGHDPPRRDRHRGGPGPSAAHPLQAPVTLPDEDPLRRAGPDRPNRRRPHRDARSRTLRRRRTSPSTTPASSTASPRAPGPMPGPVTVWIRLLAPVVEGEEPVAAAAGRGRCRLRQRRQPGPVVGDPRVHQPRADGPPAARRPWASGSASTPAPLIGRRGIGMAESALYDERRPHRRCRPEPDRRRQATAGGLTAPSARAHRGAMTERGRAMARRIYVPDVPGRRQLPADDVARRAAGRRGQPVGRAGVHGRHSARCGRRARGHLVPGRHAGRRRHRPAGREPSRSRRRPNPGGGGGRPAGAGRTPRSSPCPSRSSPFAGTRTPRAELGRWARGRPPESIPARPSPR